MQELSIAEQIAKQEKEQLQSLIDYVGSVSLLAEFIGETPQTVTGWVNRGRISATAAINAEKYTGGKFKAAEMRPDVKQWRAE